MIGNLVNLKPWSFKLTVFDKLVTSEKDEFYLY